MTHALMLADHTDVLNFLFLLFRSQFRLGQVARLLISSPISADTAFRSKGHFAVLQGMLQDAPANFCQLPAHQDIIEIECL